jgi:hypothetical protein
MYSTDSGGTAMLVFLLYTRNRQVHTQSRFSIFVPNLITSQIEYSGEATELQPRSCSSGAPIKTANAAFFDRLLRFSHRFLTCGVAPHKADRGLKRGLAAYVNGIGTRNSNQASNIKDLHPQASRELFPTRVTAVSRG